jgi:hypothetical protein
MVLDLTVQLIRGLVEEEDVHVSRTPGAVINFCPVGDA